MPDLDEFGIPIKKVELDEFGIPIKKKDGGVVSQQPSQLQSSSKNILAQRPEELPLGVPKVGAAGIDRLFSAASEAKLKLDQAVSSRDDIYADIIKENRLKQLDSESKAGLSDMVNPALKSAKMGIITQIPVTPKEIQSQKDVATTNPNAYRDVLKRAAKKDPEIAKNAYLVDAEQRAIEKPEAAEKILQNADKIGNGELNYSVSNGVLQKPEGAFVSLYRGIQERNKQVEDYDFLTKTLNDGAIIAQLEDDRTRIDPDEPQPTPSGALAEFGMMAGMEGIAMTKSAAAGLATGLIPGAQAAAPYVAAFAASPEYYQRGYSTALRAAYNEFRQRGDSEYDALQKAREQAETEANLSAAEGFASGFIGAKIGAKPTGFTVGNGFNNAVKNTLVASKNFVTENLVEGGTDAAIAGGLQIAKNISAFDKGLDRGVFDGVQENVVGELAFSFGLGAITKAAKLVINPKDLNTLVTGVARQPKEVVDAKLGEMVVTGQADPEEVVTAGKLIDEARKIDSQIPSTVQDEDTRVVIGEKIKEREALKAELTTANEAFHKDIKDKIQNIDNEILNYATTESSQPVQEGAAEGNIGEPTGTVQGQREGGTGEGIQGEATLPKADVGDSNLGSEGKITPDQIAVSNDPTDFATQMQSAQSSLGKAGMSVSPYTQEAYDEVASEGGKFLRAAGNKVLALLKSSGEMVSLVKDASVKSKGAAQAMISKMKDMGGLFMDNYDIYLTPIYEKAGYKVVARVPFDEQYAPEGWNEEDSPLKNKPDVVFMVRNDIPAQEQTFTEYGDAQNYVNGIIESAVSSGIAKTPSQIDIETELTQELINKPIENIRRSYESAGLTVNLIPDTAEFDRRVVQLGGQAGMEGVFLADDGTILLNEQKLKESANAGRIIFHEATHPVINIIRNTKPELYKRVVAGINAASDNPAIQQAKAWVESNKNVYDTDVKKEDETLVETIAMVGDGTLDLNTIETGFKQALIEAINTIARALGFKPVLKDTDVAAFKKLAAQIADVLTSGRDIAEVVGKENVKEYMNTLEAPSVVTGGQINIQPKAGNGIDVYAGKEVSKLPVLSLEEVYDKFEGKAVVINSDPTRVGNLVLPSGKEIFMYGGPGYLSVKENVDGNVGFATTQIKKVETWSDYVKQLFGDKEGVSFVGTQAPTSMLSNSYALRYVMEGISQLPKSVLRSSDFKNEFFGKDVLLLKDAFGDKAYNDFINKYKKADLTNPEVIDGMISDMAYKVGESDSPASFKARGKFVSNLLAGIAPKSKSKGVEGDAGYYSKDPQKYVAKQLLDRMGLNTEKLMREIGVPSLVDMYMNEGKWGMAVAGFEVDPNVDLNSVQSSGVTHPLFNSKFPGKNPFLLDGAYPLDNMFTPIEMTGPKGAPYTKKASMMLAGSMYVKGEPTQTEGSFEYTKAPSAGAGIQASVGGRNIEQRELVKRTNIASDKLKQLFDRDNMPLSIEEAKEIVQEVIDWSNWYDGISEYSESIFGEYTEDFLSLLPLSSQANNSASTVALAIGNSERIYKGENPIGVAEYYGYVSDFLGGKGIKSDKMYNFFKALTGDKDAIAVDMHVWSIIMGKDPNKKQVNPKNQKEFERAKEFVRLLSKELGLAPREVQASLWAANILRTGGKPDSYEEYIERQVNNKGLRERIQGWRDKGYKPFSEVRKRREAEASTSVQASAGNRLAPNGKPSNLTEKQYQQVRTPEFKNWFGDWENDPANASKVVDENGEPRVVYHGTRADTEFSEFDLSKDKEVGNYGYFAHNEEYSQKFTTFGETSFPNRKPLIYKSFANVKNPFYAIGNEYYNVRQDAGYWINEISARISRDKYGINSNDDKINEIKKDVQTQIGSYVKDTFLFPYSFWLLMRKDRKDIFKDFLKKYGYDGVFYTEEISPNFNIDNPSEFTQAVAVFEPNQIKSATANVGTFSTEDARIQFSAGNRTINWEKSKEGKGDPSISSRNPIVQEAAKNLKEGKITNEEYRATVSENSPITPITRFFEPATEKEIKNALSSKLDKVNSPIEEDTVVGLRLDIPAYKNKNTWVVSVHEGRTDQGPILSYRNVGRITDVTFEVRPQGGLGIAAGKEKTTIARMYGNWKNLPGKTMEEQGENAKELVQNIVNDPNYVQVGMNPFRHSYFYDRSSDMGRPIVSADEVVQIGGLVYAKNPVYGNWTDEAYRVKGLFDSAGKAVQFSAGNREIINGFYSPVQKRVNEFKQPKASVQKWKEIVGTKTDEAVFSGLADWLGGMKPDMQLTKEEVNDFMSENRIDIEEVEKGTSDITFRLGKIIDRKSDIENKANELAYKTGVFNEKVYKDYLVNSDEYSNLEKEEQRLKKQSNESQTKYSQYQLPGGENYKEVLITLPKSEPFILSKTRGFDTLNYVKNTYGIKSVEYESAKRSVVNELEEKGLEFPMIKQLFENYESAPAEFKSSHFDEPNIITHLRMNTRTDVDGNKVLFLEEVQSDWGQKGKREGFVDPKLINEKKSAEQERNDVAKEIRESAEYDKRSILLGRLRSLNNTIEDLDKKISLNVNLAPYVTNTNAWVKLGLKVALKEAIRQGADRIAWTTGQQQNDRYDLRKQVDEINYSKNNDGTYLVYGKKGGNITFKEKSITEKGIEDSFGKDVAEKIIADEGESREGLATKVLTGDNLTVGGKGMKDFYGDAQNVGIVGKVAKALVKELTGKEGEIVASGLSKEANQDVINRYNRARQYGNVPEALAKEYEQAGGVKSEQPAIDITPELVQAVEGGLPQFSAGNRPENNQNFKLAAFVMRKKAEGATDGEIAIGIASVTGMKPEDIKTIIDNPEQFIRDSFPSMSKLQQDNLIQKAKIQDIYRTRQFGKPIDKPFIGLEVPQEMVDDYLDKTGRADRNVKDWAKDFKRKWLDPAKGLPDWTLAIKDFATGAKNIEVARAANTIQRLKDTAKEIGFKDWEAFSDALVAAKDVQRFIPDETGVVPFDVYRAAANRTFATPDDKLPALVPDAIKKLPDEIIPFAYAMRGQIDNLTRDLIGSGYVTPEQAVTLEKNLGAYTNRAYKIFSERGYVPDKKVYNAAVKFLAQQKMPAIANDNVGVLTDKQIVEKAMEEAKKDVEAILSKKKNPYFGSKSDRRDTGILQERKDIPEPIRDLMGQYTDPGTVFIMTVAKQAALKSASQYLNKLRTMGMGDLFFERSDPSRPLEYSVEIAAKGTESMNPLGGLYTTKEIAEALDMVDPTYNNLVQAWMKGVGAVRWGKTIGSVATQAKNFLSNGGFAVLNGYMLSGENTQAFKAALKYAKGQYSPKEIDAITDKAIRLNIVGQSIGMRELKEMLGSGDVHDIAVDIALNPEGKWGKRVAKRMNVIGAANKFYRLGDDVWKVYAYMVEREQIADARFNGAKYDSLTKQQQEQVDIESSERVKNTWPTYDRVVEGAKFVSKRAPIFGNFISFQAESLRALTNSIKLAYQDLSDPQMKHLGVRRMAGISAYFGLRSAITIGVSKMAGFAAAGILGSIFGDDEEERNKRALREALPTFMRTGDPAAVQGDKPHLYTVVDMSSLDPYGVIPRSLNAFTEGREGIFGRTMEPGILAAGAEFFSGFLEPEMTFETMWSVINNKDPKTGEQLIMETDTDLQASAKVAAKVWDQLEPSTAAMIERLFERENKGAEGLAIFGMRPYEVDLHKSFGFVLSRFGKDIDAINKEYNRIKYDDKMTEQEKEAAEKVAEDKKAFAISKVSQIYRDFINIGADPKVLDELINQKSAVKVTGYDKNTKNSIKTGKISKEKLFK